MPTGPKGQRRPADAIGNAVKVIGRAKVKDEGAASAPLAGERATDE